jgi:hypothetical protein
LPVFDGLNCDVVSFNHQQNTHELNTEVRGAVYGIWYRELLFEVSMENPQGGLVRDRGVANSNVPRHRHRDGCMQRKEGLFFRLAEDSGNSPNTVTCLPRQANELPHSKLCRYCQNIFDHWPTRDTCFWDKFEFLHHGNEFELKMCAENDCSLCAQFMLGSVGDSYPERLKICERKGLKAMEGLAELRVDDNSRGNGVYYDEGPLQLSLWIPSSDGNVLRTRTYYVNLSLSPKQGSCITLLAIEWCVTKEIVTIYDDCNKAPNTRDSLPIVTEWLRRCCESHPLCENNGRKQYIPTRLLDLRNNQPRICQTAGISGNINYATLSHCWGKLPFLVLKTDNLAEFSQQIPSNALPKTFQHAIEITRYLGLQFLWIDSLCIIQDDSNDWRRESVLMTQIYGASRINLAASGATNGSEGCFFDRHPAWRCQIPTPMNGSLFKASQQLWDCYPDNFRKSLLDMPLSKRGWVLQERMLARRTLHFTRTEVFWECDSMFASETFPNGLPPKTSNDVSITKRPLSTNIWPEIVKRYSQCLLTFQKDKLVAVSGLAQLTQKETKAKYAAGLWMDHLEYQLCWRANPWVGDDVPEYLFMNQWRIPNSYRAPSWSWASVDAIIHHPTLTPLNGDRSYISFHHVHVENEPPGNAFGEVVSAHLRLRCDHLLHDRRMPGDPPDNGVLRRKGNGLYSIYNSNERFKLLLLPVIFQGDHGEVHGLWLQATGEHRGKYRRIGAFVRDYSSDSWEGERKACTPAEDWEYSHIQIDEHGKQQKFIDLI